MTNKIAKTTIMTSIVVTVLILGISATSSKAFASAYLDLTGDCDQPTKTKAYGGGGLCGFVGKGDVQNAYNPTWNNKQLQDRANDVDFVYVEDSTYDVVIQWFSWSPSSTDIGNCIDNPNYNGHNPPYICSNTHSVTQTKTTNIDAAVNADPRKSPNQFTGFNLISRTTSISGGPIPNVGDDCPNGGPDGDCKVISVTPTGTSGSHFNAVWHSSTEIISNDIPVVII